MSRSALVPLQADRADADLVELILGGDLEAFDLLMDRHLNAMYVVALAITGAVADAEDVCQEAFVVAMQKLEQCRNPSRVRQWLIQIVRSRAHNLRRYRSVRSEVTLEAVSLLQARSNPAQDAERSELRDHLLRALQRISKLQRQVLMLFHVEGWNHAEIAEILGTTETTSRSALYKGRIALKGLLKEPLDWREDL